VRAAAAEEVMKYSWRADGKDKGTAATGAVDRCLNSACHRYIDYAYFNDTH